MKVWLREAKSKKDPERRSWELVVILVQMIFSNGTVPEDMDWVNMVLLPKGKGGYQGIVIIEFLLKV